MTILPTDGGFSATNSQMIVPVSVFPSQHIENSTASQSFEELICNAVDANAQVNDDSVRSHGDAIMKVVNRGFSHMDHQIEEVSAHMNEVNSSLLNVNEYAMKQAVNIRGGRDGYREAQEIILKQNALIEDLERKFKVLEDMIQDLEESKAEAWVKPPIGPFVSGRS